MSKYIELIDKYRIEQRQPSEMSEYGSDMNPPNYIWDDNTGEIVRCENCENWDEDNRIRNSAPCAEWSDPEIRMTRYTQNDDYCSKGAKKDDTE